MSGAASNGSAEREIRAYLASHEKRLKPLMIAAHLAYWDSATTGDPEAARRFARADAELKKLYAEPGSAAQVRSWLAPASPPAAGERLRRQLLLLDLQYTGNQLPAETLDDLAERTAALEQVFHTFRARLDGERMSNNQLLEILRGARSSDQRRVAWEASKQVAQEIAEPLRELVRRRNAAARTLGFADYFAMGIALQEQDETRLFGLLDEFKRQSDPAFRVLRREVDEELADRFGIVARDVRPWHWDDFFAQEAPAVGGVELDRFFRDRDAVALTRDFFAGIGLPVDGILARSDLFEREGKSQHAFCIDIDREGDVRVLCNLRRTEHWAMVLLHELGHAVYDEYLDRELPFVLRTPAHTFSTEAVAMFMGRLTRDPRWLRDAAGAVLPAEEVEDVRRQMRLRMLTSARWILVMVHFERALYRDPDRNDLGPLWWDLVEEMQLIPRPAGRDEPDWAAKIHLSGAPVYYHNYLLGELMASQLAHHLGTDVPDGRSLVGNPDVGTFFRDEIFARGASLDWDALLREATGEGLNPRYFVEQFVES